MNPFIAPRERMLSGVAPEAIGPVEVGMRRGPMRLRAIRKFSGARPIAVWTRIAGFPLNGDRPTPAGAGASLGALPSHVDRRFEIPIPNVI